MTRWLLSAVAVLAVAFAATADDPKPNPFLGGKPAAKAEDKKPAEDDTKVARVAHVKLSGDLDEAPVGEPLFGPPP